MNAPAELSEDGELASSSLVDLALARLSQDIFAGVIVPGERLVEQHLTRRFGVSRGPVREALRLLEQQGLVEHLPRRGARVALLSDRDVQELFGLRDVLERYAVDLALPAVDAPPPDPGQFTRLSRAQDTLLHAAEHGRPGEAADAHHHFHVALVATAGHRQLLLAYESVLLKLRLYMAANLRREAERAHPMDGVHRHQRLLDACLTGRRDAVAAELEHHGARTYFP